MSVEAKVSCTTTCASETDDGDYETSSEGPIRKEAAKNSINKNSSVTSNTKMGSQQGDEAEDLGSKEKMASEVSFDPFHSNVPTKSESMPLLKSTSSTEDTADDAIAISSESSLARQRKMKMIVARIDPLLSSGSSQSLATTSVGSRTELTEENYQAKKLESRTVLPVLQDTDCDPSHRLKEVTFHEPPEDKDFSSQKAQSPERKRMKSPRLATRDTESRERLQENGDLIDIAENPHPSIKSFYFPPNPEKDVSSASLRTQSRVAKDLDSALRIIDELHPLQHQLNEILGQFRALSLANPSLLSYRHHSTQCTSSSMSGYYLRRTETFDRNVEVNSTMRLINRDGLGESAHEVRGADYFGVRSFYPSSNQMAPLSRGFYSTKGSTSQGNQVVPLSHTFYPTMETANQTNQIVPLSHGFYPTMENSQNARTHGVNPRSSSSRCIERKVPSGISNWTIGEDDSQVTLNNFHMQFGQFVAKEPSGSLIPTVSSSCYRCHQNRDHAFPRYDDTARCSSHRDGSVVSAFGSMMYRPSSLAEKSTTFEPDSLPECSVKARWTPLINQGSQSRFNDNAKLSVDEKPTSKQNSTYSDISFRCPPESASASLKSIVSDLSRLSRTQYPNSQTSVRISKKDQNVTTSEIEQKNVQIIRTSSRVTMKSKHSKDRKTRPVKDFDVQCSGLDLKSHQKEIVLRQSMESLLKPSESEDSNVSKSSTKSIQVATDEKVVVVPIVFTDGVPEPKVPMFTIARSRTHLHNVKCQLINLKKETSPMTRSSVASVNSTECVRSMKDRSKSKMSVYSMARSSLRCGNGSHVTNTAKTQSDHRHGSHKQKRIGSMVSGCTGSTKAHSEPTKKKVMYGMRSSPEDFAFDT